MNYKKIKKLRQKEKMSQENLALLTNLSRSYISLLESEMRQNPSMFTLQRIATALNMPLEKFISELQE